MKNKFIKILVCFFVCLSPFFSFDLVSAEQVDPSEHVCDSVYCNWDFDSNSNISTLDAGNTVDVAVNGTFLSGVNFNQGNKISFNKSNVSSITFSTWGNSYSFDTGVDFKINGSLYLTAGGNSMSDYIQSITFSAHDVDLGELTWSTSDGKNINVSGIFTAPGPMTSSKITINFKNSYTSTNWMVGAIWKLSQDSSDVSSAQTNKWLESIYYVTSQINVGMSLLLSDIFDMLSIIDTNVTSIFTLVNNQFNNLNGLVSSFYQMVESDLNVINSSIINAQNSIVSKLDETLVIKDKTDISNNDDVTSDLSTSINDYDTVEKDLVTDFNESLDSIDVDSASSIYNQNDFIKSAQFISTNMQNIYDSNDYISGFIDLTLLLGLIFTVIGIGVR